MLRSLKDFEQYTVAGTDGDVGSVADFMVEDERWIVRYLVVDAVAWFDGGRQVLISPISFRQTERSTHHFQVALTRDEIEKAPNVDVDGPVTRQHERDYHRYYGYSHYWGSTGYWGAGSCPDLLSSGWVPAEPGESSEEASQDIHLRSAKSLRAAHIQGSDYAIGHIHDFIVDDATWAIRYFVVDTSTWWFGKKVLIAPHWIRRVGPKETKVYVDLSRDAIKKSPEWNESEGVNREYEVRLYDYHGRPAYWSAGDHPEKPQSEHRSGRHAGLP